MLYVRTALEYWCVLFGGSAGLSSDGTVSSAADDRLSPVSSSSEMENKKQIQIKNAEEYLKINVHFVITSFIWYFLL